MRPTLGIVFGCLVLAAPARAADAPGEAACFQRATRSSAIAGYSLGKVQRWLREVALKQIDPDTGLYVARGQWNYHNTAADCYPFLCWAAYATDREALRGPLRDVLHAEIKLCNHLDRIPAPYDFEKKRKVEDYPMDRLMFGASEYVKDGLIAIVEVTGKDEWFERMKGIEEDMWKHAQIETPYGKIPSSSQPVRDVEIDGEQLQALVRLHTMTGDARFLRWAQRLGDYYLKREGFVPPHLRDHGCEIVGGLGLLVAVESEVDPQKAQEHLPPLRKMLDAILARGCNPDGFMVNAIAGQPSGHKPGTLSDGWGYNYVAFLCYDMAVGKPHYRAQIERTLRNLAKPVYRRTGVGGQGGDSSADSAEGAMYLLNRCPVPEGFAWVDHEVDTHLVRSGVPLAKARLWGVNKWECNCVRTVIMHALMHTRGLRAVPWRSDLKLGAAECGDGLAVVVHADRPWKGRLVFDVPRHRLFMGFGRDWPRMNTLPEWFTVEPDRSYTIRDVQAGESETRTGRQLHEGLPVELDAKTPLRLMVESES